ncbi:MAG TPA: TonB-dependent receptor [Gemmatimonadaceae bacterium]|nr:TonB-dependent receptor [Gemmatimonadaceae bacterium]
MSVNPVRTHATRSATIAASIILGSLLLSPAALWAQTVAGTVQTAGKPIVGATVRLLELDRIERTGAEGQFAFSNVPAGVYRVYVGVTGYASATDTIRVMSGTARVSFNLRESAIKLKEVVVSASPTARISDEQYQSTASKSQVEFQNSPGTTFAEKISDLPGVAVRSLGSAPSRPILRGLGDNEVLILENGLRMGDLATFDPAHATPIEAIGVSQIDVVRGPATILYGPSTIGGIVNIITDIVPFVSDHAVSGTAAIEGNTVNGEGAGYINNIYSQGNQAFRVSAGGVRAENTRIPSGNYTDPGTGAVFNLDRMPQTFDHSGEAGLGYAYQGDFGTFGIGGKHFEVNYGIPGVPPNPDFANVPPTTSRIAQRRNTVEFRSLFNHGFGFIDRVKLNASFNDYNHSEFPTAQDASGVSDPEATHFQKRQLNGVLQLQHQALGKLQGTLGLWTNIENMSISGDEPLGPNSRTIGIAGYAYEEYPAAENTRLQAGLRYDYNKIQTRPDPQSTDPNFQTLDVSRLSNAVTASLGAIQTLTPQLTGSLSFARSFRAPTVQELFANGLDAPSGTYTVGTPGLEPETGLGADLSLKGNFANASFEISPYANSIQHYIYGFLRGDTIQNFPARQFGETNARLLGFDASVTVQPAQYIALKAGADYVNAEDTRQHVPLPFTPPLRGLLRATFQNSTYMGLIETRIAASQTRLGEGDTPTPGYTVVNVGAGMRFARQRVLNNISIHCDNVFNRVYRDNLSVIKDFIPQPARGFRVNYEVTY